MGGVDDYVIRLYDTLFPGDADGLGDEQVHQLHVLQPLAAELRQKARVYQLGLLRAKTEEELERKVGQRTLDDIHVRDIVDALQKQILEHAYRVFCHAPVVGAVFVLELVVHEAEVHEF